MRERNRDKTRLEHIIHAMDILDQLTHGRSMEQCEKELSLYYSIIKNLEIIGEAVYMLTPEFKEKHPEAPWKFAEKQRHVLVHDYYIIDFNLIWDTIFYDLPQFRLLIEKYLTLENQ